jgi:hypothetical protein
VTAVGTQTSSGARLYPKANAVKATNVKGMVDLGPNATGTTISNVDFTAGPARTIVRVNAGSDVAISAICAPSGSQIVGTGLATYEGQPISLPYTLSATNNCRATGESVPKPPELVEVR